MSDRKNAAPMSGVSASGAVLRLIPPVLGLLLAVLYCLAMSRDFDFSIGHFAADSVPFRAAVILGILGAAVSLLAGVCLSGRTAFTGLASPGPLSFAAAAAGAVLAAALCVRTLLRYSADLAEETAESLSPTKLYLAAAVLGIFLSAALILSLFREKRHRWYALICTLFGGLSVNVAMFAAYFDFSVPLNSPVRNFTTLCQASALLFLLSEARLSLTREDVPGDLPTGFQTFASSACAVFCVGIGGGGAAWQLIRSLAFGSEILDKTPEPNLSFLRLALYLALGLLAADRLLHTDLRRLSPEEIAENRRKAREEKERKKNAPADGDNSIDD